MFTCGILQEKDFGVGKTWILRARAGENAVGLKNASRAGLYYKPFSINIEKIIRKMITVSVWIVKHLANSHGFFWISNPNFNVLIALFSIAVCKKTLNITARLGNHMYTGVLCLTRMLLLILHIYTGWSEAYLIKRERFRKLNILLSLSRVVPAVPLPVYFSTSKHSLLSGSQRWQFQPP